MALLYAKARVVPNEMLKQALKDQENHNRSIPRLELNAARCVSEYAEFIASTYPGEYKKYFWCDSQCVLKWIRDVKMRFKTFIHNRLATIHTLSEASSWDYLPTHFNPADVCSRGIMPGDPG
jgi:hypothetical protein